MTVSTEPSSSVSSTLFWTAASNSITHTSIASGWAHGTQKHMMNVSRASGHRPTVSLSTCHLPFPSSIFKASSFVTSWCCIVGHKRLLPATPATTIVISPPSPLPTRPLASQHGLTSLWQLLPPYLADRPIPCVVARSKQLSLACSRQRSHSVTEPSSPPAPPSLHYHARPTPAQCCEHPCSGCCTRHNHQCFARRTYAPHAAANPANYTLDHDPDKL